MRFDNCVFGQEDALVCKCENLRRYFSSYCYDFKLVGFDFLVRYLYQNRSKRYLKNYILQEKN